MYYNYWDFGHSFVSLVVLTPVNKSGTIISVLAYFMHLPKLQLSVAVDLTWSNGHTLTTMTQSVISTVLYLRWYRSVNLMSDFPHLSHLLLLITFISLVVLTPVNKSGTIMIYACIFYASSQAAAFCSCWFDLIKWSHPDNNDTICHIYCVLSMLIQVCQSYVWFSSFITLAIADHFHLPCSPYTYQQVRHHNDLCLHILCIFPSYSFLQLLIWLDQMVTPWQQWHNLPYLPCFIYIDTG